MESGVELADDDEEDDEDEAIFCTFFVLTLQLIRSKNLYCPAASSPPSEPAWTRRRTSSRDRRASSTGLRSPLWWTRPTMTLTQCSLNVGRKRKVVSYIWLYTYKTNSTWHKHHLLWCDLWATRRARTCPSWRCTWCAGGWSLPVKHNHNTCVFHFLKK